MEEQELALRCARGDNAARRELYMQYGSRILALCRRYVSDPADAEDLRQDAFVKIYRVIGRFRWTRPGSLYAWMSRVTINLAFDSYGKRRRLARQLVDVETVENVLPDESTYEEAISVPPEVLAAMIEALPEGYRTVFKLYCIDGLSHKDIAALLGIKEKSSSASLSRARALLSDAIREYWRNQEEGASPESWAGILRKMRRATALRVGATALAVLLPVSALLLWHSDRQPSAPPIAEVTPTAPVEPTPAPEESIVIPEDTVIPYSRPSVIKSDSSRILSDSSVTPSDSSAVPDDSSVIPSEAKESVSSDTPTSPQEPRQKPKQESRQDTRPDPIDPFLTLPEQIQRNRPRISLSLRAGSGTARRSTDVNLNTTPYIAALTYMNEIYPSSINSVDGIGTMNVRSNYGNAIEWLSNNSALIVSQSTTDHYRHDLPVSFGLTARMELTPRLGVESGLEYTYLHSTVLSEAVQMDQRLHFVGIPVRVDTRLWSRNGIDLYAGLGAKAEKCISATMGKIKCEEPRLQWSTEAFAGVQYRIAPRAHLYFQPQITYSLTKTDLVTYRTETPLMFTLNAGLRFDLK
ncbi:MAG: sigma-70 family RNA polymerase sigma factor [Bacteroidales bacterium]|nr:sigma-70 family RNA polymerase sigma factor [Bacteroidales bacterium]